MKLYGMPHTRSIRITWALEEAGLDAQFQLIDLSKGEGNSPEFLQINPAGKIPVLEDEGFILSESSAICNYIARKVPEKNLIPIDNIQQLARHDQWSLFALCELEQPLWTFWRHTFVYPEALRVPEIISCTEREFQEACRVLSTGLGDQQYILGDDFSMADILLVQSLLWAGVSHWKVPQANLNEYITRAIARPAFQRAREKEKNA